MSNAAVTPSMRAVAWNVHFTIGQEEDPGAFAGIYQAPGSDLVTFRNVYEELRLCFELDSCQDQDSWSNIAFFLSATDNCPPSLHSRLSFVADADLDIPVPSLPPLRPKEQNVLSYHIVRHKNCLLSSNSSLESHLQAKCARHLPNPVRRRDRRYLPPNKTPSDPRLILMPLRRKLKARSQSPPKRSASGSTSPTKEVPDEFDSMLAPASINIDLDEAKRVTNDFRSSCLNRAIACAVSGEGESWCPGPAIGPGVQACHIVPQQHYHLYPTTNVDPDDDTPIEESSRRLREAWESTWSPRNGVLLMKHLHDFFDARLFSIHPRTLRIRVFVPYNALTRFNGQKAAVPTSVDRKALRHHYEMSCIENMAAERPNLDVISPATSRMATSGTATPFSAKTDLPVTPSSTGDGGIGRMGDPAKRWRPSSPPPPRNDSTQDELEQEWVEGRELKRTRMDSYETDSPYDCFQQGGMTPWNSRAFLADVDWELQKVKRRRMSG
ncbi:hypothetical protein NW762_013415 [Fusarium torreyae]|uniref:HNH nuclease domain-containing protein n=1 Tax=Fusarium torreyae TaxID=1237075 RepID=A0A9W8VAH2_9HYPO|nr:hypothetical protein NW762_013415 [Fusarium torreyae]